MKQSYYGNVNPDLLERIPLNARTVVEVGCGSGALGHAYKFRNPQSFYIGVEAMHEPAAEASKVLDQVIIGNAENPQLFGEHLSSVDCLVYGDVLEHLVDPWACLSRHLELLSEEGLVVACIPNVQHWSVIANLLQGQWPMEDQGLFDRTHLRWFTKKTIVQGLQKLGLHIHEIKPRIFKLDQARIFVQNLTPSLQNFGLHSNDILDGMLALIKPVTTSTLGRCVARMRCIPAALAFCASLAMSCSIFLPTTINISANSSATITICGKISLASSPSSKC